MAFTQRQLHGRAGLVGGVGKAYQKACARAAGGQVVTVNIAAGLVIDVVLAGLAADKGVDVELESAVRFAMGPLRIMSHHRSLGQMQQSLGGGVEILEGEVY
ncbi:hypothetical protein BEN49_03640 [Hymenobacter coccineus]|uniref:Uncharacterized protein n=1 Tax=Hymenobacter coccineus TaxID=1908235 RepID=A0A1G1TMU2_9BACT|nr:hypothetical protein BEN49_03640 [Hymenobacter coccineus]